MNPELSTSNTRSHNAISTVVGLGTAAVTGIASALLGVSPKESLVAGGTIGMLIGATFRTLLHFGEPRQNS